jgi:hypothetical protein
MKSLGYIILGIIIAIIGVWAYNVFHPSPLPDHDKVIIDSLEHNIILNNQKIDSLNGKVIFFQDQIIDLNTRIDKNNIKLNNVIKFYNEKITAVDTFSNDELLKFFTDRYNPKTR